MTRKIPELIKKAARELRKNMTPAERKLWNYLRYDKIGVRFLRQKAIYVYTENTWSDRYIIVDFYCHEKKFVLEIDGKIHNIHHIKKLDTVKEDLLSKHWIQVLRIKNNEIEKDIEQVLKNIKTKLI